MITSVEATSLHAHLGFTISLLSVKAGVRIIGRMCRKVPDNGQKVADHAFEIPRGETKRENPQCYRRRTSSDTELRLARGCDHLCNTKQQSSTSTENMLRCCEGHGIFTKPHLERGPACA